MIVKSERDTILSYFEDSSNIEGGSAQKVIIPESIDELSSVLAEASRMRTPVTVSGGGTGTTGARVPFGGVILSMERFASIVSVSRYPSGGGSAVVQAGVLVDDLKNAAADKGLLYTCHPTEETAQVGGTISTNASGARSFKYGPTRKFVKRLTVVLPNGAIARIPRGVYTLSRENAVVQIEGIGRLAIPLPTYTMPKLKHSAGYYIKDPMDLIDLFIGQEGTLAVIVEAELELVEKPEEILSSFAFFKKPEDAWSFSVEARDAARMPVRAPSGVNPLSIEYLDRRALEILKGKTSSVPGHAQAAVFFEQEYKTTEEDSALAPWLALLEKHGVALDDTWVAMTVDEQEKFNEFRHFIPYSVNEIVKRRGSRKLNTDIAVPDDKLIEMMKFYRECLTASGVDYTVFGHIGESHLHVTLLPASDEERRKAQGICERLVRKGIALGGTVSAEHGIGKTRRPYLEMMYGRRHILEMARLKKAIDPSCILGLGNIFAEELLKEV